jgi:hypothetical protein
MEIKQYYHQDISYLDKHFNQVDLFSDKIETIMHRYLKVVNHSSQAFDDMRHHKHIIDQYKRLGWKEPDDIYGQYHYKVEKNANESYYLLITFNKEGPVIANACPWKDEILQKNQLITDLTPYKAQLTF